MKISLPVRDAEQGRNRVHRGRSATAPGAWGAYQASQLGADTPAGRAQAADGHLRGQGMCCFCLHSRAGLAGGWVWLQPARAPGEASPPIHPAEPSPLMSCSLLHPTTCCTPSTAHPVFPESDPCVWPSFGQRGFRN